MVAGKLIVHLYRDEGIGLACLIDHRHEADGPGPEEGAGEDWFLV